MKFENTKIMRSALVSYCNSDLGDNLDNCYERPSQAKWDAMDDCKALMRELNGHDMRIISYNKFMFTCGFKFTDENSLPSFAYITPTSNRYMHI